MMVIFQSLTLLEFLPVVHCTQSWALKIILFESGNAIPGIQAWVIWQIVCLRPVSLTNSFMILFS